MIGKKIIRINANDSNECYCPHCNSGYLYIADSYFDDLDNFIHKFVCRDCGAEGEKIYNLVFNGYTYYEPDNEN